MNPSSDQFVESLKFVADLARNAVPKTPQVVVLPGPTDRQAVWYPSENKLTESFVARPRVYKALSVAGFVSSLNFLKGRVAKDAGPAVVFVGRSSVMAMLGEDARRERIVMDLQPTLAYSGLKAGPREATQQELLRALRVHFRSEVSPAGFMGKLAQIRWTNSDAGTGDAGVGRQSVSQTVVRELSGIDGSFPDQICVKCNVFVQSMACNGIPMWTMQLAVEPNPETKKFSLTPIEGELQSAEDSELASIAAYIRQHVEGVEVVEGTEWAGASLPT